MAYYLIGTGGWAYFPSTDKTKLRAYAEVFNFVEVNYTFYKYPDLKTVEHWRKTVPATFEFSVRCHQDLTHRIGLKPVDEAYHVLGQMLKYCQVLEGRFLVLETPASYVFNDESVEAARELFKDFDLRGVRLVWENRSSLTQQAQRLMQDLNIVHSVDLSTQTPLFSQDVIYTRLFGKGNHNIYQFTDEELQQIDSKILSSKAKNVAMSYHGVRMNSDAMRFLRYKKDGKFPSITGLIGVASAKAVLAEDTRFPISKQALIDSEGWKVFDASHEKRLRLSDWLSRIPQKTYVSIDEVTVALEATA